jgi:hypothetical protein
MPDLEDVTDSSDNEENDTPLLKSFSESSEDEGGLYGDWMTSHGIWKFRLDSRRVPECSHNWRKCGFQKFTKPYDL